MADNIETTLTEISINNQQTKESKMKNIYTMSETELLYAILWETTDVVAALIDQGADINKKNKRGETALMIAIEDGDARLAYILIEKGANVNEKNGETTALMLASARNYDCIVTKLIEKGAKLDETDENGETALDFVDRVPQDDIYNWYPDPAKTRSVLLKAGAKSGDS